MALIIRMRQQGASSRQQFRLVVTDTKIPRDGKYLEMVGWYNPFGTDDKNCLIHADRVQFWLEKGAQISDRAKSLVKAHAPEVIQKFTQQKVAKTAKKREKRKKA